MGKEINRIIVSKDDKPETMISEVAKYTKKITKLNGLELDSFQVDRLARDFLFKENFKVFFVPKGKKFILPTVKLELWLLERDYQEKYS